MNTMAMTTIVVTATMTTRIDVLTEVLSLEKPEYPDESEAGSLLGALIFPAFEYTSTRKIAHQGHNGYDNYRGNDYYENTLYSAHFLSCLLRRTSCYVHFVSISSL